MYQTQQPGFPTHGDRRFAQRAKKLHGQKRQNRNSVGCCSYGYWSGLRKFYMDSAQKVSPRGNITNITRQESQTPKKKEKSSGRLTNALGSVGGAVGGAVGKVCETYCYYFFIWT